MQTTNHEAATVKPIANDTITIKNELPDLLEAVCEHPACPEWLKEGIWDAFGNQGSALVYTRDYWRLMLHAIREAEQGEIGE